MHLIAYAFGLAYYAGAVWAQGDVGSGMEVQDNNHRCQCLARSIHAPTARDDPLDGHQSGCLYQRASGLWLSLLPSCLNLVWMCVICPLVSKTVASLLRCSGAPVPAARVGALPAAYELTRACTRSWHRQGGSGPSVGRTERRGPQGCGDNLGAVESSGPGAGRYGRPERSIGVGGDGERGGEAVAPSRPACEPP